jgi:ABC-type branched-subunit amino acid transport system ATPase component
MPGCPDRLAVDERFESDVALGDEVAVRRVVREVRHLAGIGVAVVEHDVVVVEQGVDGTGPVRLKGREVPTEGVVLIGV